MAFFIGEYRMSKEEEFRIKQLERKVAGMQEQITSLKTNNAFTQAELKEYKKTNDMAVRNLTIRDAVLFRRIDDSGTSRCSRLLTVEQSPSESDRNRAQSRWPVHTVRLEYTLT